MHRARTECPIRMAHPPRTSRGANKICFAYHISTWTAITVSQRAVEVVLGRSQGGQPSEIWLSLASGLSFLLVHVNDTWELSRPLSARASLKALRGMSNKNRYCRLAWAVLSSEAER